MQKFKQFPITALVILFLLLFLTSTFVAAQTNYSGNTVTITSGTTISTEMRGNIDVPLSTDSFEVTNNQLIVESSGRINNRAFGGKSNGSGKVSGNFVRIDSGGRVTQNIFAGYTDGNGDVTGNKVEVNGTAVAGVFGGESHGSGNVANNEVLINGIAQRATGGITYGTGHVTNNEVTISGNAIVGMVYGGHNSAAYAPLNIGNVSGNIVKVSENARVTGYIYGGWTGSNGIVSGNLVEIYGRSGTAYGGRGGAYGAVSGNKVIVTESGSVDNDVIGGIGSDVVNDNTVIISGTAVNVIGGRLQFTGDADGNTVIIESFGTAQYVYGGDAVESWASGDVVNNTVIVKGIVDNAVYGGYTLSTGKVENNTVNIESTAILTTASLWGSNISGVVGKGNTLNVNGFSGTVDTMVNFENYNFELGLLDSANTFITINGSAVDIDDTTINISFSSAFKNNNLNIGDTITIISKIASINDTAIVNVLQSTFMIYNYTETHDTGALLLTIDSVRLDPEAGSVGEGFAAGLAFLGQAADVRSSIYFVPQGPRFIPFAKMIYGKQYISTGSSVNVKGFSAIAGLALNTNFDNGSQLVVGAFVESGWGDYNSRHSFSNSTINGKGDTEYYGGGVLARYAMQNGLYGEGTFAAGKAETDFRTYDYTPGTRTKYDYSVPYYSAHVAMGKIFNMCDIFSLDLYGKYLWTRQAGDHVTVDSDRFKFKDADSHRVRVGGKLKADIWSQLQPYAGAAYEYEFSGKIKGSLYGMNLDKPSLRGGTGIGELGLVWTPNDAQSLRVDLGVQGYAGKREGVSGGLTVTMSF